ncbi:MAG TPA: RimK family alpha-L-glutamate ligase [Solirubrobacteraceae bacterium]|nr:RimK family alpha-L-glutamate ligase [Solirubrobacteraceae bacterium]
MRVVVLGAPRTWHAQQLERALTDRGHEVVGVPITRVVCHVHDGVRLSDPDGRTLHDADAALVRGIPRGSLEQVVHRLDVLHLLETLGLRVLNAPRAIERTVDKQLASALLARAGLATPATVTCERSQDALTAFDALGGDVVVKPLFGAMGHGIARIDDRDVAHRVFRALELERAVFYLQRTLAGERRRDLRVLVLGDAVLGAIERVTDHWKANVAGGARPAAAEPTAAEAELAVAAAHAVGAELAGVDLLTVPGRPTHVIEVNGIPGWQALQRCTGVDVAAAIAERLAAAR